MSIFSTTYDVCWVTITQGASIPLQCQARAQVLLLLPREIRVAAPKWMEPGDKASWPQATQGGGARRSPAGAEGKGKNPQSASPSPLVTRDHLHLPPPVGKGAAAPEPPGPEASPSRKHSAHAQRRPHHLDNATLQGGAASRRGGGGRGGGGGGGGGGHSETESGNVPRSGSLLLAGSWRAELLRGGTEGTGTGIPAPSGWSWPIAGRWIKPRPAGPPAGQ